MRTTLTRGKHAGHLARQADASCPMSRVLVFWSIAMARMSGLMAAAGLAFINTVGLIGGFVGPYLFGLAQTKTGNPSAGFTVVIWSSIIGVLLALLLHVALRREDAAAALRLPATRKA